MSQSPLPTSRADAIIERLHSLYPRAIDLELGRLLRLLAALGHPQRKLPPVIHVAGTNGKGSCCAFLRAIAEAAGQRVHVFSSPHLVSFNERIRLAGTLVTDAALEATLEEVERVNASQPITIFEVITAAAFLLVSRVPADLLVLETGLGGRFDATNVVDQPAACAITSISMDHMDFLGDTLAKIAGEKAGILKRGVPAATGNQSPEAQMVLEEAAAALNVTLAVRGQDWTIHATETGLRYTDPGGSMELPPPALPGPHQADNAGIAIAALRSWDPPWLTEAAIAAGLATASWPARLQRLHGALAEILPPGWELWLDGGHNAGGGLALAAHLPGWADRPRHLVIGMKKGKEADAFLRPLLPLAESLWAVAEPGQHLARPVEDIIAASGGVARPGPLVADALRAIAAEGGTPGRVLICGSLYLAGEVLKADGTSIV